MSKRTKIILIVILILVIGGVFIYKNNSKVVFRSFEECAKAGNIILESYPRMCRGSDGTLFVEKVTPIPTPMGDKSNLIRVSNPKVDEIISSPFLIEGEARGNWFFEGSFSGELLDEGGKRISTFIAEAQGEWMTTEFVPFKSTLEFKNPWTQKGTLIFHKDNPSDKRELDDELRVPVKFATTSTSH
ncbi:MAG: Gmad2 immunoglobulin-like domain-containing protein [Candidatus Taylorbacteria bacterium]